jgi:hypothetical protein
VLARGYVLACGYIAFISFVFLFFHACALINCNETQILYLFVQIHLFGEGKVCQSDSYKADSQTGIARLQRIRWGMCMIVFFPFMQQQPYI